MKLFESQPWSVIFKFVIPFITGCALINQYVYWSTFNINLTDVLEWETVVAGFVDRLLPSILITLFSGLVFGVQGYQSGLRIRRKIDAGILPEYTVKQQRFRFYVVLITGLLTFLVEVVFCYTYYVGLNTMSIIVGMIISMFLFEYGIFENVIPDKGYRVLFYNFTLILFLYSISSAKVAAYDLLNPTQDKGMAFISVKNQEVNSSGSTTQPRQFKIIGITNEFVFALANKDNNVFRIPVSEVVSIYYPKEHKLRERWQR